MGFSAAVDRYLAILRCMLLLVSNLSLTASNIITLLYIIIIMTYVAYMSPLPDWYIPLPLQTIYMSDSQQVHLNSTKPVLSFT